ncbi:MULTISPECIES: hypothetical protein [unclassified Chelatococcus]|uniref:hypothetical protein n=1 Tax=unclassified Chelatococcus TaxID=2638111 RepID=UPI0002EB0723|nr:MULTISPECIES: hypothetical protein [unclassified Chelatococcus]ALA16093.1 hypothetical protein AL346_00145 [Chelatococcus sp. CO-6]
MPATLYTSQAAAESVALTMEREDAARWYVPAKPKGCRKWRIALLCRVSGRFLGWHGPKPQLAPVRSVETYAVISRAVWCRGPEQAEALDELNRRGCWLSDDQKRAAGLTA